MSNRVLKNTQPVDPNDNRRKAKRRPVLDSFSVFVVAGQKSVCRLRMHDLSELGVAFEIDIEGQAAAELAVQVGVEMELQLYLNQTLHIPLQIKVVRVEESEKARKVGAEYSDKASKGHQALLAFIEMLDRLSDIAQIDAAPPAAAAPGNPS